MKKRSIFFEFFKTVLIALLFVSMVALASSYILGTQRERLDLGNDIVFDKLLAVENNAADGADRFNHEHIIPELIGIKKAGQTPRIMLANSGYIFDMYESVMPCITAIFGQEGICEESYAADAIWRDCMDKREYIYVRYHNEFPFSLLYAHSKNTDDSEIYKSISGAEGYVYEFFLFEDTIVARDMRGKVLQFTLKEGSEGYVLPDFERYLSRCLEFEFAKDTEKAESVYYGTPVIKENISTKNICVDNYVLSEFGNTSEKKFRELLRLFDFNPDKLNVYIDPDDRNASMFVESHGVFRSSSMKFEYTASSDGGISIVDVLPYQTSGSGYDLYDCLKVAEYYVDRIRELSPLVFGEDAALAISDIRYNDGKLIVEYSYYYENVLIEYGNEGFGLRIEISDDKITALVIRPISISASGTSVQSFSQKLLIAMQYDKQTDGVGTCLNMRLNYTAPEAINEEKSAEWKIIGY